MSRRSCSFVIPAFNEEHRLPATLTAIAELSLEYPGDCEIIVADDGSADFTSEIAFDFSSPCRLRVLGLPHRGKGAAIRSGVAAARGDVIVLCDADLQNAVGELVRLEQALRFGADVAIGSRWLKTESPHNQPLHRRVPSRIFHALARRMLTLPFKDTQCGLKAMSREAAQRILPLLRVNGWGYDIELIHVALALGMRVEEVAVDLSHDYRTSHFRPLTDGWAACRELIEIRRNQRRGAYLRAELSPMCRFEAGVAAAGAEAGMTEDAA
jgi:dolichyl-phosphate beta-glucosyltransferase